MGKIERTRERQPEVPKAKGSRDGKLQLSVDADVATLVRSLAKKEGYALSDFVEEAVVAWMVFARPGKYEIDYADEPPEFVKLWKPAQRFETTPIRKVPGRRRSSS